MLSARDPLARAHARAKRRTPGLKGLALVLAAIATAPLPLPAHAQSPIIQGWLAANTACKGVLPIWAAVTGGE